MQGVPTWYGFPVKQDEKELGVAALIVYAIYKSRDAKRFSSAIPAHETWSYVQGKVELDATRAGTRLAVFMSLLAKDLHCDSVKPRWARTTSPVEQVLYQLPDGSFASWVERSGKEFLVEIIQDVDERKVLKHLRDEALAVCLFVRQRIDREKRIIEAVGSADPSLRAEADDIEDAEGVVKEVEIDVI